MPSSLLVRQALLIDAAASEGRKKLLSEKYGINLPYIEEFAEIDPTPNGAYTEWITREYKKDAFELDDVIKRDIKDALVKFNRYKNSPEFKAEYHTNILDYTFTGLIRLMETIGRDMLSKKEKEKELQRRHQKYLDEGCTFLGNQRGYAFFEMSTPEAAVLMGQGSHWCTKNEVTARNYLRSRSLYVITTEDEKSAHNYGSDRFAQLAVPRSEDEIGKFEFQDVDGNNLFQFVQDDMAVHVDDAAWWMIEALEPHDSRLQFFVKKGFVFSDYEDMYSFLKCEECHETTPPLEEEDMYYTDDGAFCCRDCFIAYYENKIQAEVERLYHPDSAKFEKVTAELEFYINSPESPEHEYFELVDRARHAQQPDTADEKWNFHTQLNNAKGGARATQERIDKIIPGLKKETAERVYEHLKTLMDQLKEPDDMIEEVVDYVKEEFTPSNMDVAEILREGGYIEAAPKTSSLLKKRAKMNLKAQPTTEPELTDTPSNYPISSELRTAVLALKSEFENSKQGRKGTLENGLVDSFLKGSEVWKKLATDLNSQNRRLVLQELNREGIRRGHTNVRHSSQMGDGDPRR